MRSIKIMHSQTDIHTGIVFVHKQNAVFSFVSELIKLEDLILNEMNQMPKR